MLLVDDDQAEVGEAHVLLDEGVGSDDDPRGTAGCVEQRGLASGRRKRAGEQRDPSADVAATQAAGLPEGTEQRLDRPGMLRGEHLGGCKQRGLPARVDDLQHRPQRDDRLAGADLALQQPMHRVRARQVIGEG